MSGKEVLYEAIAAAEVEFQNASKHGFEQHASQIKTDEGDESEMPSWRLEQIQARKEEEAEDMSELAVVAPKQYKRKMQKNKQQLQKKEDIYAIIKMAEQGEDVLDNPGGLPGFGDRSDTDGEESEDDPAGAAPVEELSREQKSRTKINRNRRATERFDANQFPDQELAAQVSQMGVNADQKRTPDPKKAIGNRGRTDSVIKTLEAVAKDAPTGRASQSDSSPSKSKVPGLNVERRWYVGKLERTVCETAVRACMQGDYLIRKSASSSGYVLCINDSGSAINYTISAAANSKLSFTSKLFDNLDDVVKYTNTTPLKSIARPGSRLVINKPAIVKAWFSMGMTRQECEDMVRNAKHGDFMVRLSTSGEKYVLVVNDQKHACSYSITMNSNKQFVFGGTIHECVENVVDMMKSKPFKSQHTEELTLVDPASHSI